MARLPQSIPLAAPRGTSPSMDVPAPTDLGLGAAAESLAGFAATKKKVDDQLDAREAQTLIDKVRQGYEPEQAKRAAEYDGAQPGYARSELDRLESDARGVLDGETRVGVRNAAYRQLDDYKAKVGDHVLAVESAKRAEPARLEALARDDLELSKGVAAYVQAMADGQRDRRQNTDPSLHGWAAGSIEDHDAAAAKALAAAPESQRPRLQVKLNALRPGVIASASDAEEKGRVGYVVSTYRNNVATLGNGVLTEPSLFDQAVSEVASMATALPGDLRAAATREATGDLAEKRIRGFIADDQLDMAQKELDGGNYDKFWDRNEKEQLSAAVEAARTRRDGKKGFDDYMAQYDMQRRVDAETYAIATTGHGTGGVTLQQITEVMGPAAAAKAAQDIAEAHRAYVAVGDVSSLDNETLRNRAKAPPPDTASPSYAKDLEAWQLGQKAATAELAARDKDPAAWAQRSTAPGDWGAQMQAMWQAFSEAGTPEERKAAATRYAANVLGVQEHAGIPVSAQRIMPREAAARMVDAYAKAAPEAREAALAGLATMVMAMPDVLHMKDGRTISGRQLVLRELDAAGLAAPDLSAIADLSDEPARLGSYVAAVNNPAAKVALPKKGEEAALVNAVTARLAPFIQSANALPGSAALNAARTQRVMLTARNLVLSQGMSPKEAAQAASADLVDNYTFLHGLRIPKGRDAGQVNRATGLVFLDLVGVFDDRNLQGGTRAGLDVLPAAAGVDGRPLTAEQGVAKTRQAIKDHGRWITREGDDGLMLVVPTTRDGWQPVVDKFGRPVSLSWAQLQGRNEGKAGSWLPPAPAAASEDKSARIAPAKTADALARAVEHRESGGRVNAVSSQGALGVMQLLPGTAQRAARRLGVPYDLARLTTDADYNRRLGREELRFLSKKYDGNVALVAAAYHAGPDNVDAWIRRYGDPRRGVTADQWVAALAAHAPKTSAYVAGVLPHAMALLK